MKQNKNFYSFLILNRLVLPVILLIAIGNTTIAQDNTDILKTWLHYSDARNALYHHMANEANGYLDKRENEIAELKTVAQWEQRQKQLKQSIMEAIGGLPERTPLNAKTTSVIKKEGYTLENVIYESQPGFYVTASLFIPEKLKGKAPAILFCSGHSTQAFRRDIYQVPIINLVKKGFVVLAFDPIGQGERVQYLNSETNKSIFNSPTKEHSYPSVQVSLLAQSVARYFIWDGIRGIDYLESRKEVDANRIGVHGLSGGGTQTSYISALDDRVVAAAPAGFITSFRRLLQSIGVQDGEQNFYHGILSGIDHGDFIEMRAPKPTLIMATTNDFFSIQGTRETYDEIKDVYSIFGKPENITKTEDDYHHGYTKKNREAMYAFFQKYLDLPGSPDEEEVELLSEQELQKTKTGQLASSGENETVFSLNKLQAENYLKKLDGARKNLSEHLKKVPAVAKKLSGYREPSIADQPVFVGRIPDKEGYVIEKYLIKGEGDYVLPYFLFIPDKKTKKAVFYLHPQGKQGVVEDSVTIQSLMNKGITVLAPDILGTGELANSDFKGDAYINNVSYNTAFMAMQLGRSIVGIQAGDIVKLLKVMKEGIGFEKIYGIAQGEMGPALLYAAAFEPVASGVALLNPYSSYSSLIENKLYESGFVPGLVPGALTAYDLPDLAASLAPAGLWIAGITDAYGECNSVRVKKDLDIIKKGYKLQNAEDQLKIINKVPAGSNGNWIEKWLKK